MRRGPSTASCRPGEFLVEVPFNLLLTLKRVGDIEAERCLDGLISPAFKPKVDIEHCVAVVVVDTRDSPNGFGYFRMAFNSSSCPGGEAGRFCLPLAFMAIVGEGVLCLLCAMFVATAFRPNGEAERVGKCGSIRGAGYLPACMLNSSSFDVSCDVADGCADDGGCGGGGGGGGGAGTPG